MKIIEEKRAYGEKVLMTQDEFRKLLEKYGAEDAARLVEILDDYLVNHPKKKYSSHYRAILSWCVIRLQEEKIAQQRLTNAQQAAERMTAPKTAPNTNYARLAEIDARRKAIEDKYKDQ